VNPSKPESEKRTNFKIALIPENPKVTPSNSESVVFKEVAGNKTQSHKINDASISRRLNITIGCVRPTQIFHIITTTLCF